MPFTSAKMAFSATFYRYYRFHITQTQGLGLNTTVGKIQMFVKGRDGQNVMTPTAQTWSSSYILGSLATNVLNMLAPATVWSSALLGGMPQWIELDAGSEIALSGFIMASSPSVLQVADAPTKFILKGSNDRVTYDDLQEYTTSWSGVGSKTFTVTVNS